MYGRHSLKYKLGRAERPSSGHPQICERKISAPAKGARAGMCHQPFGSPAQCAPLLNLSGALVHNMYISMYESYQTLMIDHSLHLTPPEHTKYSATPEAPRERAQLRISQCYLIAQHTHFCFQQGCTGFGLSALRQDFAD